MNDHNLGFNQLLELTKSSDEFRNKIFILNQDDSRKFQVLMNKSSTFKNSIIICSILGVSTAFVILVTIDINDYDRINFENNSIKTFLNGIFN